MCLDCSRWRRWSFSAPFGVVDTTEYHLMFRGDPLCRVNPLSSQVIAAGLLVWGDLTVGSEDFTGLGVPDRACVHCLDLAAARRAIIAKRDAGGCL